MFCFGEGAAGGGGSLQGTLSPLVEEDTSVLFERGPPQARRRIETK